MPKLDCILEEDKSSTDIRANEFAYTLTLKNTGDTPIELITLQPRIPSDVTSVEIKNPTSEALKAKYEKLCIQLEYILNNNLMKFSEGIRKRIIETNLELLKEVFEAQGNILMAFIKLSYKLFSGRYKSMISQQVDRVNAYTQKIENFRQAEEAFVTWLDRNANKDENIIYRSKMFELKEIEDKLGTDIHLSSLATIEPDSFFSQTYVFVFLRNKWEPKLYNISIESTFRIQGNDKKYVDNASTSLVITPDPRRLTILAVASSILGAIVKYCIEISGEKLSIPYFGSLTLIEALESPTTATFFLNSIIGMISALVFFNVYEQTSLGKKINFGVSWRSGLLIGVLCGLLGDRIIAALKALIP